MQRIFKQMAFVNNNQDDTCTVSQQAQTYQHWPSCPVSFDYAEISLLAGFSFTSDSQSQPTLVQKGRGDYAIVGTVKDP
jgi:hypothetical protein